MHAEESTDRPLRAVLFDLGETLATREDWAGGAARALTRMGLDGSNAESVVADADAEVGFAEGVKVDADALSEFRRVWCEAVIRRVDPSAALSPTSDLFRRLIEVETLFRPPYDEVHVVLDQLSADGWRMGVISDNDGRAEAKTAALGIAHHFEFILDSMTEGVAKPDAELLQRGARRMGLDPAECAYVGNRHDLDVVAARAAGMVAIWVNRKREQPDEILADIVLPDLRTLPQFLSLRGGA